MRAPLVRLSAAVLVVAALTTACGDGDGGEGTGPGSSTVSQAEADTAMDGLCDIAAERVTEPSEVRATFQDRSHAILHEVAAEAEEIDAEAAGALLEAKFVVEADLEEASLPDDLPEHARALAASLADALAVIGLHASSCEA